VEASPAVNPRQSRPASKLVDTTSDSTSQPADVLFRDLARLGRGRELLGHPARDGADHGGGPAEEAKAPPEVLEDEVGVEAEGLNHGDQVETAQELVGDAERDAQGQKAARVLDCPDPVGEVHAARLAWADVDAIAGLVDGFFELALAEVPGLAVDHGVPEAGEVPARMPFGSDGRAPDHDVFGERGEVDLHLNHGAAGDAVDPRLRLVEYAGIATARALAKASNISGLGLPRHSIAHTC